MGGEGALEAPQRGPLNPEALPSQNYPRRFEVTAPIVDKDKRAKIRARLNEGIANSDPALGIDNVHYIGHEKRITDRLANHGTKVLFVPRDLDIGSQDPAATQPPTGEEIWLNIPGNPEDIVPEPDKDPWLITVSGNVLGSDAFSGQDNPLAEALDKKIAADEGDTVRYDSEYLGLGLLSAGLGVYLAQRGIRNSEGYRGAVLNRNSKPLGRRTLLKWATGAATVVGLGGFLGRRVAPQIAGASANENTNRIMQDLATWTGPKLVDMDARKMLTAISTLQTMDARDTMVGRGLSQQAAVGILGNEVQLAGANDLINNEEACIREVTDYFKGFVPIVDHIAQSNPELSRQQILLDIAANLSQTYISQIRNPDPTHVLNSTPGFKDAVDRSATTVATMYSPRVIKALAEVMNIDLSPLIPQ